MFLKLRNKVINFSYRLNNNLKKKYPDAKWNTCNCTLENFHLLTRGGNISPCRRLEGGGGLGSPISFTTRCVDVSHGSILLSFVESDSG